MSHISIEELARRKAIVRQIRDGACAYGLVPNAVQTEVEERYMSGELATSADFDEAMREASGLNRPIITT